jgi:hypothetical protein
MRSRRLVLIHSLAVAGAFALAAAASGCGVISETPMEIPVGGVRQTITAEDLAVARERTQGGLLEPTWLPDGFALINVSYIQAMGDIVSVDLAYDDGTRYVHIWQTNMSAEQLGAKDPMRVGEPVDVGGIIWQRASLEPRNPGRQTYIFNRRLPDGRTVSLDGDLELEAMHRVLESLGVRGVSTD